LLLLLRMLLLLLDACPPVLFQAIQRTTRTCLFWPAYVLLLLLLPLLWPLAVLCRQP
jgi:hypothetical protein